MTDEGVRQSTLQPREVGDLWIFRIKAFQRLGKVRPIVVKGPGGRRRRLDVGDHGALKRVLAQPKGQLAVVLGQTRDQ